MPTCIYLYELQNSPAVPAPVLYQDVRDLVAVTGLALCPREPAMDQVLQLCVYLVQQVSSKAGKGPDNTECSRAGTKKSIGQPSVCLSVSEDSLLSVHCVKVTFVLELVEAGGERR